MKFRKPISMINTKQILPQAYYIQMAENQRHRENLERSQRGGNHLTYKEMSIRISKDFSSQMKQIREWSKIFKFWKKKIQSRIPCPTKLIFKIKWEIKII